MRTNEQANKMTSNISWKEIFKKLVIRMTPLFFRKCIAVWISGQGWLRADKKRWWSQQLISDLSVKDPNAYHKFMWLNHMNYAETYEISLRYGFENFNQSRKIFLSKLVDNFTILKNKNHKNIDSVFEVGCSSGYLLRHMEEKLFSPETIIHGCDIDKYAIDEGNKHLKKIGSNIELFHTDMEKLIELLEEKQYDFMFAAGVLLYLDEHCATRLVKLMLSKTKQMLAITALACPSEDNSKLENSIPRNRDKTWIHNVDRMITQAGGKIIARQWDDKMIDGNTIYFLFATPN